MNNVLAFSRNQEIGGRRGGRALSDHGGRDRQGDAELLQELQNHNIVMAIRHQSVRADPSAVVGGVSSR